MKTKIIKSVILSTVAVALIAWFSEPASTSANEPLKGAPRLLQLAGNQGAAPAGTVAPASGMSCTSCKDVPSTSTQIIKGHVQITTKGVQHTCPACSSALSVVGSGKAKQTISNHTCGEDKGGSSCCGGKS